MNITDRVAVELFEYRKAANRILAFDLQYLRGELGLTYEQLSKISKIPVERLRDIEEQGAEIMAREVEQVLDGTSRFCGNGRH